MKKLIFPKITLSKKQILYICIPLGVIILLGIALTIYLLNKDKTSSNERKYDYVSPEGYAQDSKEYMDLNFASQDFGDQEPKYKIYGETGYTKFGFVDSTKSPLRSEERTTSVYIDCGENEIEPKTEGGVIIVELPDEEDLASQYTTTPLSEEPVEVGNHCKVQFNTPYENIAAQEAGEIYSSLNSYVELPDGSLITVTSMSDKYYAVIPEIQVNIFENETRVVLFDGGAYFRIIKQPEGKIFSIQVNDRIFKTSGPAEIFASARNESKHWDTTGKLSEEQVLHPEYYTSFDGGQRFLDLTKDEEGKGSLDTGAFRLIAGEGDVWVRGTNEKGKLESNKTYIVADSQKPSTLSGTEHISSAGYVEDDVLSRYLPNIYTVFISSQIALNKSEIGLNISGTDGKSTSNMVSAYVKHYKSTWKKYIENQIEEIIAQEKQEQAEEQAREEARRSSYSLTITCPTGMYYIGGNSCCPNGYVYSSSKDKCTKTTYYSQNTKTPRYNPSNSGGSSSSGSSSSGSSSSSADNSCHAQDMEACFEMGIMKDQCPGGAAGPGFYVKNGECCQTVKMECVE